MNLMIGFFNLFLFLFFFPAVLYFKLFFLEGVGVCVPGLPLLWSKECLWMLILIWTCPFSQEGGVQRTWRFPLFYGGGLCIFFPCSDYQCSSPVPMVLVLENLLLLSSFCSLPCARMSLLVLLSWNTGFIAFWSSSTEECSRIFVILSLILVKCLTVKTASISREMGSRNFPPWNAGCGDH